MIIEFQDGTEYDDEIELLPFERSVDNAIACIEWRAMKIFNNCCKCDRY